MAHYACNQSPSAAVVAVDFVGTPTHLPAAVAVAVALGTAFDDERLGVAAVEPVESAAFVESMMAVAPGAVPAEAAVRTEAAAFVPAKIGVGTIAERGAGAVAAESLALSGAAPNHPTR